MDYLQLDRLFNPRHVTMIGASAVPGKWGFVILFNILKGNHAGNVYPVNPRQKSIFGLLCYSSVVEIPGPVDLAIIATPAASVSGLSDQCGVKGIPNVILISSDFSETGPEGAELERHIVSKVRGYGMRLVWGPIPWGFSAQDRASTP